MSDVTGATVEQDPPRRVVARRGVTRLAAPRTSDRHSDRLSGRAPSPAHPVAAAREALARARSTRAAALIDVVERRLDVEQFLVRAATEEGRPLRRTTLRQLLLAQPDWRPKKVDEALSVLAEKIGLSNDDLGTKTVSWLIDPRASGRRHQVWQDTLLGKPEPWGGFPHSRGRGNR